MNVDVNRLVDSLAPGTADYFSYGEKKTIAPLGINRKAGATAPKPKNYYKRKKGDGGRKFHLGYEEETPTIELPYLDRLDLELMQLDNDIARSVKNAKKRLKKNGTDKTDETR